jgi:hypothetical protein
VEEEKQEAIVKARDNNLPTPEKNHPYVNGIKPTNDEIAYVPGEKNIPLTNDKGIQGGTNVTSPPSVTYNNTEALGKAADNPDAIYASADENSGKKNKLRGFFRKVTRTFEKRTNIKATDEDDDHLLIAGLAIKLN